MHNKPIGTQTIRTLPALLLATLLVLLLSTSALADNWQALQNDAINSLLTDREVIYEGQSKRSQTFYAGGATSYVDGRPSSGNWKVEGDQYCSQWPPGRSWSCYNVFVDDTGERIRFTSNAEDDWIGQLTPVK